MATAEKIIIERAKKWGDPVSTHSRIAKGWSAVLNHDVTGHEVALCMTVMKAVRSAISPEEEDNYPDMMNYAEIAEMHHFPENTHYSMLQNALNEDAPF